MLLFPLSISFLNSKILGFHFCTKNCSTWAVKCEKVKLQKIVGNLLGNLQASKIVHEWNGHLEIFSRPQVIENSGQYLLLRKDITQKTVSLGAPVILSVLYWQTKVK